MATFENIPLPSTQLLQSQQARENADDMSVRSTIRQSRQTSDGESHEKPHSLYVSESQQRQAKQKWFRLWWFEMLAMGFSLTCLIANIGFLRYLDEKPYQSWRISKVDITPNAIISFLATLNKASMLLPVAEVLVQLKWLWFQARRRRVFDLQIFDDASRGPLGSLRLLWNMNLRVYRNISVIHA